jgi:hypothetical protein
MLNKLLIGFLLVSATGLMLQGCSTSSNEATTTTTSSTTTTTAAVGGASVVIRGSTATAVGGASISSVRAYAGLSSAEVFLGIPLAGSDTFTTIITGATSADGNYSLSAPISLLSDATTESGFAANLMVIISKEGTVIGCVIPSLSLEAGAETFAPTADPGEYKKQLLARAAFKKGTDPRSFDFTSSIDSKFSGGTMADYDLDKLDKLASSIHSSEAAERSIAEGLGISSAILDQLKEKGFELHKLYIEPIMRRGFETKTPPSRAELDLAFSSMEAAMKDFAIGLGLTEQQFADLRGMKDKTMETKMGEEGLAGDDPAFEEAKRRMGGSKMVTLFLGQWDAANTLANVAPSGKEKFAITQAAAYNRFVTSKEAIVAQLNSLMGSDGMRPEQISGYLRSNFFDAFVFPPPSAKPEERDGGGFDESSMEAMMRDYVSSRIMVYFMQTFLTERQRMTYFMSQEASMQPIFRNRFDTPASPYYMGEQFWNGTTLGHRPSPEEVQARLVLFNAALDAAMDDNTALQNIFRSAGFSESDITTILKSFRILMAPPDMF